MKDQSVPAAPHLIALQEFYQGEILGEAMFDAMLDSVHSEIERYKIALMLQLETETKARLRPVLAAQGLSLQEDPQMRLRGAQFAQALVAASWTAKMSALHQALAETYLPRYREHAAAMPPGLRAIAQSMVEHEQALLEMTRRELDGDSQRSDEPVRDLLAHPLPRPSVAS
jgi:hypothetical protein